MTSTRSGPDMTNPNTSEDEDKPLDPAMERVRRKMVRLLFVSSSAIVLALMAVLGSIVYKANKNSAASKAQAVEALALTAPLAEQKVVLPKGFVNDSNTVDGNRIWFSGSDAGGRRVMIVYDISLGKIVSEITVEVPQ